jgi:ketosteroid isomerase-like protein
MMKALLPVILLGLGAARLASAECSAADLKALEDFDRAWGVAAIAGDKPALEKIYADDFSDLALGDVGLDRDTTIAADVAEAAKNAGKAPAFKTVPDHYAIHCYAGSAVITHRNTTTGVADNGKAWTTYRRSVHVLEKRKSGWQVVSNAGHPLGDGGQLLYMEQDWNDADMNGDASWYERNVADDYTSVSSRTGTLSNKAEDVADARAHKNKLTSAVLSDLDARVSGDTAVVVGVNHVKGMDDKNQAFDRRIRFTDVYVKHDGRWLVWATQGTVIVDKK